MLTSGDASDSNGYYVKSGADGSFDLTNHYTCTSGQQVYVYATGGDPLPDTSNPAISLMAVLGDCTSGNFSSIPYIELNELSTVAAAYALEGFTTDALHIADDEDIVANATSAQAQVGMATAFANAANLVDLGTGTALSTNPKGGTVPTLELNTLGDILAACVNTDGGLTTGSGPTVMTQACGMLFDAATTNGIASGTQPTDTFTAMLNIVRNPGAADITSLWTLANKQSPFQNTLTARPNDFTVAVSYGADTFGFSEPVDIATTIDGAGGAGVYVTDAENGVISLSPTGGLIGSQNPTALGGATSIAVDVAGNAWVGSASGGGVLEFIGGPSSSAFEVYPGTGPSSLATAQGIAIDAAQTAWVTNAGATAGGGSIVQVTSLAPLYAPSYAVYTPSGTDGPLGIAIDENGNKWITNAGNPLGSGNSDVTVLGPLNGALSPTNGYYNPPSFNLPAGIAIDSNNNAWVTNLGSEDVFKLSDPGTSLNYTAHFDNSAYGIVVDGAGNLFTTNVYYIVELANSGSTVSPVVPLPGYANGTLSSARGIAVDGSGDVWVADTGNIRVVEFIGLATPVVTPIATGLFDSKLGSLP